MAPRDPAAAAYARMQLARMLGLGLVIAGIALISPQVNLFPTVPDAVAYAVIAAGLFGFFWLPLLVARKYRTPPE